LVEQNGLADAGAVTEQLRKHFKRSMTRVCIDRWATDTRSIHSRYQSRQ
jgi:hypothetical protein